LLGGNASAALVGDALVSAVGAHEELIHVQLVLEVSALYVLGKRVRHFALIVGARRHGALRGEETASARGPPVCCSSDLAPLPSIAEWR
jgi:hypothetical protein